MTHLETHPASRKRPLAPDIRRMDDRSARAWTEAMAVEPIGGGRYAVHSGSDATYVVTLATGECTCPDHRFRSALCKHVRRVAIEVNRGEVPPPGHVVGVCAACGSRAFVPEHEQPPLCTECHLEPGDVARDRVTGTLVVVARVRDERADQVRIDTADRGRPDTADRGRPDAADQVRPDAADTTVAAYPTNRDFPDDDVVVDVVYPFSADPDVAFEALRRYSFPRSRLERRDEQLLGPWSRPTDAETVRE